jgi:competence protein ComEC
MGFYIEMISVGEGDCFFLTLDNPKGDPFQILIDGGNRDQADKIIKHINEYGNGYAELVIGTHLDNDHIGGLIGVIENIRTGKLILNTPGNFEKWLQIRDYIKEFEKVTSIKKLEKGIEAANDLLETAKRKEIVVEHALQGRSWSCEDIKLNVLNPTAQRLEDAWAEEILKSMVNLAEDPSERKLVETEEKAPPTTHSNDASIIMELIYHESPYALFTGDAGAEVIREVTGEKSYTFLKVPHHGSKTGLDEELIQQLRPAWAYIPVGENPHGHPSSDVLDLLKEQGGKTYCSEKTSNCRRECKGHNFEVLCHREDRPGRNGWTPVDPKDCKNNPQ